MCVPPMASAIVPTILILEKFQSTHPSVSILCIYSDDEGDMKGGKEQVKAKALNGDNSARKKKKQHIRH